MLDKISFVIIRAKFMLSAIKSLDYFSFGNPSLIYFILHYSNFQKIFNPNLIYFILHVTMVNIIFTGPWRACGWVRDSIKQGEYSYCKDKPPLCAYRRTLIFMRGIHIISEIAFSRDGLWWSYGPYYSLVVVTGKLFLLSTRLTPSGSYEESH